MLKLSALLSLLKTHLKAHEHGHAPISPEAAGTIGGLLSSCEAYAKDMEAMLAAPRSESVDLRPMLSDNVILLSAFAATRRAAPANPNETA